MKTTLSFLGYVIVLSLITFCLNSCKTQQIPTYNHSKIELASTMPTATHTAPNTAFEPILAEGKTLTIGDAPLFVASASEKQLFVAKPNNSHLLAKVATPKKLNIVQKTALKYTLRKAPLPKTNDFNSWDSMLKIGVILLGVGLVLAIVGLGLLGGLAGLIGLAFLVLGLIATYN